MLLFTVALLLSWFKCICLQYCKHDLLLIFQPFSNSLFVYPYLIFSCLYNFVICSGYRNQRQIVVRRMPWPICSFLDSLPWSLDITNDSGFPLSRQGPLVMSNRWYVFTGAVVVMCWFREMKSYCQVEYLAKEDVIQTDWGWLSWYKLYHLCQVHSLSR